MRFLAKKITLCLFLLSGFAWALDSFKLGVVDMDKIVAQSLQTKEIRARLEKDFGSRQKDLLAEENELKSQYSKLQRDRAIMNSKEFEKKEQELAEKQKSLIEKGRAFQQDFTSREQQEQLAFKRLLDDVVGKIAEKHGYHLILMKQQSLHSAASIDVTVEVLQKLTQRYNEKD